MAEIALAFSCGLLAAWAVVVRIQREHESLIDDRPRATDCRRSQSLRVAGALR